MKSLKTILAWASTLLVAIVAYALKDDNVAEIQFDLGQNIHETAKRSGAPKFATRNVAGLVSYKLIDLPADIPAIYKRSGCQIDAVPLFAFALYADTDSNNNLAVEIASLQFRTDEMKSHELAKTLIEKLIAQFQRGQWIRFVSDLCRRSPVARRF